MDNQETTVTRAQRARPKMPGMVIVDPSRPRTRIDVVRPDRDPGPKCGVCMSLLRGAPACLRCGDRGATPAGNELKRTSKPYHGKRA